MIQRHEYFPSFKLEIFMSGEFGLNNIFKSIIYVILCRDIAKFNVEGKIHNLLEIINMLMFLLIRCIITLMDIYYVFLMTNYFKQEEKL